MPKPQMGKKPVVRLVIDARADHPIQGARHIIATIYRCGELRFGLRMEP